MKRILLLHTVKCMYLTFADRLREAAGKEIIIDEMLDTYFANNANELGYFSQTNLDRLYLILKAAEKTGADAIGVICSTLSPYVKKLEPLIKTPIITIDERLGGEAIKYGDKITILASAQSAVAATTLLVKHAAELENRNVEIYEHFDLEAFSAMMSSNMPLHDKIILKMAAKIKNSDAVVLAQGSMEHLAGEIGEITGVPVVTAPSLCLEDLCKIVK